MVDQGFDVGSRDPDNVTSLGLSGLQHRLGNVVAVPDALLDGMTWCHAHADAIEYESH